ncbi:phosphatase PAP2 family protein [Lacimonas salitolerans]|uniref:Phosphatase PAP2 family protein n=1 Tax=Lacimonas salitolerans TaxID=1323750 RepID=A0ABW4EFC7_9RHOB
MASSRIAVAVLALMFLAGTVFLTFPGLDPAVSRVFADLAEGKFPLAENEPFNLVRMAIWRASIALFLLATLGLCLALFLRQIGGIPARLWGFILLLYVAGPGILVEWGLKGHWGRARPAYVSEFGGPAEFTPFWQPTDQCLRNCSFVGGESAGATVLAISLWLVLGHFQSRLSAFWLLFGRLAILTLPVIAGFHRIAAGRHFLSDVIFSMLLVALLAIILARVLSVKSP